jgi:drug/metabolite transporter (DMT)-like permease
MPGLGLVPFFGVIGAAVFLDEALHPLHVIGGALVIAGIAVPARRSRRQRRPGPR